MISALTWVPKGASLQTPKRNQMSEEDFQKIATEIGAEVIDAKESLAKAQLEVANAREDSIDDNDNSIIIQEELSTKPNEEDVMAKYDLDNYDEEEGQSGIPVFGKSVGLTYHVSNDEDPYITMEDQVDEDEELGEMEILPTDNLIIACKTEDDVSHLEIYLYEEEEDNLYVHHDIMLPSFPLCCEWLNYHPGMPADHPSGNFVAIGTFDPTIEIWDIDSLDAIYPTAILGSTGSKIPTGKKKKQAFNKANPQRHVEAITSISWNKAYRNLILTGSADTTIKLWDISTDCSTASMSYTHHTDKVTAVQWNPKEATVFLSGGYDLGGRVCALDSRNSKEVLSWTLGSDVECLKWDPFRSERFLVSTEDGLVRCFDGRVGGSEPLYTLHAHDSAVSSLDFSAHLDGLLITGGADKMVKVWDVREGQPKTCIVSRDLGVGKVFAGNFCTDSPFVLAASGSKGKIVIWNLENNQGVRKIFGGKNKTVVSSEERKEIIGVADDEVESDNEEEWVEDDDNKMNE